jgi:hypothetical protein
MLRQEGFVILDLRRVVRADDIFVVVKENVFDILGEQLFLRGEEENHQDANHCQHSQFASNAARNHHIATVTIARDSRLPANRSTDRRLVFRSSQSACPGASGQFRGSLLPA